jgi:DNA (cytosine-5)-methyltransferase 1
VKKKALKKPVVHSKKRKQTKTISQEASLPRLSKEPDKQQSPEKIPVLSYFTGAGLLDLGFLDYNFDVIWRNENNAAFVEGFEYGMSTLMGSDADHRIHNKISITDLTPRMVANEAFHNTGKPATFGIIGGPPCPDFSNGGKNRGGEGDHGKLTEVFVRHILELKPAFFLLENVIGLHKTVKHKPFLDKLIARLNEHYYTSLTVLNALEYGVPQHRERVFLAGFRKKWLKQNTGYDLKLNGNGNWFPWPEKRYNDPKNSYQWPVQVPFGSEPEKPGDIPAELMVGTWICDPDLDLETLPNGQDQFLPKSDKFRRIDEGDDTRKSFKRLHRWRYSPAAAYGNNEVHLHPVHARRLSVREVMRIQSVPDTYALPEHLSLTNKFKMIANGVPLGLAKAVASSFGEILTGKWHWDPGACHKK